MTHPGIISPVSPASGPDGSAASAVYDFEVAARAALGFLRGRMAFDLWMVTRRQGEYGIVLHMDGHHDDIGKDSVFRWSEACSDGAKRSVNEWWQARDRASLRERLPFRSMWRLPSTGRSGSGPRWPFR